MPLIRVSAAGALQHEQALLAAAAARVSCRLYVALGLPANGLRAITSAGLPGVLARLGEVYSAIPAGPDSRCAAIQGSEIMMMMMMMVVAAAAVVLVMGHKDRRHHMLTPKTKTPSTALPVAKANPRQFRLRFAISLVLVVKESCQNQYTRSVFCVAIPAGAGAVAV